MSRPYSFLDTVGLTQMANPNKLPVYLVRVRGGEWERQPAFSSKDAARKFIRFAGIKSGVTIEALRDDQDPATDQPFTYKTARPRRTIK